MPTHSEQMQESEPTEHPKTAERPRHLRPVEDAMGKSDDAASDLAAGGRDGVPPAPFAAAGELSTAGMADDANDAAGTDAVPGREEVLGATAAEAVAPVASARRAKHAATPVPTRRRSRLSTALLVVGVMLLVVAAGMWGLAQWQYARQDQVNQELAAFAVVPEASRADSGASADAVPLPPEVDWAGLRAVNPEAVAWLQVPGTTINYPVYQASDNDRYLRHDAHGEWSVGGQLFMDCDGTAPGMQDQITLVYGHHLRDGSMFEQIAALDDQARFDAVERVWYVTDATAYDCVPLFVCYVHETDEMGRSMRFASDEDFHAYVAGRLEGAPAARADASKLADEADHLLFLVTCNYLDEYEGHGRTILACAPRDELESLAAGQG